jgi:2-dehydro-3-deoxygluconokinase
MSKKIVTFGEIMGRFAPEGFLRFRQAVPGFLGITFGGAEGNVAASIALLGKQAVYVTALPKHALADACVANLKAVGVDTSQIIRTDDGRLGLFFLETGANQRPSNVIYDRADSSISLTPAEAYPWKDIFKGACWFHVSGITPAISKMAAEATLVAVKEAKAAELKVSCDLNFRKKLWQWDRSLSANELAEKTIRQILPYVDLVIANEEDASDVLSIRAGESDVHAGRLEIDRYPEVAKTILSQFENVSNVAITLRESISATHNNWGAMLYCSPEKKAYFAPCRDGDYTPYKITNIVDRVGGGDSFAAGLIFALTTEDLSSPQTAISFAAAASCLAHSIHGDYNYSSRSEVETLMRGSGSGRVVR